MSRRRDASTLDLFHDYAPKVVDRFEERDVRASSLRERIARAVAKALKDSAIDRSKLAADVSAYLGEDVTKNMLDQYASQAGTHAIPSHRLIALAIVTGQAAIINAALQDTGLVAIETKYEPLIEREMTREAIDRLQQRLATRDAQWKANR